MFEGQSEQKKPIHQAIFLIILVLFIAFSVFIAIRLKPGIAPDEKGHFLFSNLFSETWGIPKDSEESIVTGWVIKGSPFVYYWINGRIINIIATLIPAINDFHLLIVLRLINVLYASLSLLILYQTSIELIKNPWLQLLPTFLLANTLMWVFLSGAVSYDNLANMLCFAAILFFVRAFKEVDFHKNALLWIIMIMISCQVKYTILPLAGLMTLVWTVTGKLKQQIVGLKNAWSGKIKPLFFFAGLLTFAILMFYSNNLIRYQSFIPTCSDLLDSGTCMLDPMLARYQEMALPQKLTITESIEQGYPNPLEYIFYSWIPNMLYRIYGILGHLSYFPSHIIIIFYMLSLWYAMLGYKYLENHRDLVSGLIVILAVYAFVLLAMNYHSELIYGFKQIAMQGRYLFPVIGIAYILMTIILEAINGQGTFWITVSWTVSLFVISGPIKFLTHSHTIFFDWYY